MAFLPNFFFIASIASCLLRSRPPSSFLVSSSKSVICRVSGEPSGTVWLATTAILLTSSFLFIMRSKSPVTASVISEEDELNFIRLTEPCAGFGTLRP